MVLGGAGAPIATAVPVIMNAKKVAAPAAKRSAKRPAGTSAGKGSKVTGRSRLEFIGMALALHVLFGRKVRDIILMTRQYAVQAFSFGLQYLQRPSVAAAKKAPLPLDRATSLVVVAHRF